MKYPHQTIDWAGRKVTFFNREILILDQKGNGEWTLPGGTVEEGETPVETLTRDVMEEADVTLKNISVLGVQKVDDPQNSGPKGKLHYQARFVARVDQIQPQTVEKHFLI